MMKKTILAMGLTVGLSSLAFAAGPTFEDADKNADGKIDRDEAAMVEGFDFDVADANDDGSLSRTEYGAAHGTDDDSTGDLHHGDPAGSTREPGGNTHGPSVPGDSMR